MKRIIMMALVVLCGVFLWGCSADTNTSGTNNQEKMGHQEGDIIEYESGLKAQILKVGSGAEAVNGSNVKVHYVGTFLDGEKFDSSRDRGTAFNFTVGGGQVIKGWDEGVEGMLIGELRKLEVPPELGYGSQPVGPIPANSTLIFEVELLEIVGDPVPRGEAY